MIKMKRVLLLLIAISFAGASYVEELDEDNFSSKISEKRFTLTMFYAPWCGHCKQLKPDFEKAAEDLKDYNEILLAKVDCTAGGKEKCEEHGITGYPTLKIFDQSRDKWDDYKSSRDPGQIVKYMKALVEPASKEITSKEEFDKLLSRKELVLVQIQNDDKSELTTTFMSFAEMNRAKYVFAHTNNKDIFGEKLKIDASEGIFLHRPIHLANKFEPAIIKFEGRSGDNLSTFIKENAHGLVGHRTGDNVKEFKNPSIVAYYRVDYNSNHKGTNYWRNRIFMGAKDNKEITFAISAKDEFQHELNEFGYDYISGDKPVILARDAKNLKYKMQDDFSVENLQKFVKDFVNGKLTPYVKSEDIPDNNDQPVKVAVAKNFDDVVINNDKDTLIEFYAPWCGHCKKLAPIFDELGEKLKDENIAIVKMDATSNDIPTNFNVKGFPTLYWLPKNAKANDPVLYNGGRDLDDFVKYIAKHATDELNGFDRKGRVKKVEL